MITKREAFKRYCSKLGLLSKDVSYSFLVLPKPGSLNKKHDIRLHVGSVTLSTWEERPIHISQCGFLNKEGAKNLEKSLRICLEALERYENDNPE